MPKLNVELETLAVFVHGALAFGHALGAANAVQVTGRQWYRDVDFWMHAGFVVYDGYATAKHLKRVRREK